MKRLGNNGSLQIRVQIRAWRTDRKGNIANPGFQEPLEIWKNTDLDKSLPFFSS
jgi:hypothetical protein